MLLLSQGDYYSYSNYDGNVEDMSLLNVDQQYKLIYKDFITGACVLVGRWQHHAAIWP